MTFSKNIEMTMAYIHALACSINKLYSSTSQLRRENTLIFESKFKSLNNRAKHKTALPFVHMGYLFGHHRNKKG